MKIQGSVVVVTGASSGIGLATARSFAKAGAKVVLAARSTEMLNAVAEELHQQGHEALAITTDVRDQAQVNHLIDATCEHFGRVDILINNAGQGTAGFVIDTPVDHFRQLFDLNVFGPLYAMQAAIKRMRQQSGGLIINVSSGAGRRHIPGFSAYSASKAALDLISNTARGELATENIRVVTIYPPNTASNAAKNMLGDPHLLMGILSNVLKSTSMVPETAESVAEKIVEAARTEPADLFLDEEMYKEVAS
jgi:NAD(P)-dependent dehydrogenase (short-subunit alcohol dehydrogenase family)